MSFSYGFYNSKNHDREYDAFDVSCLFDGLIADGVFAFFMDGLLVKESADHYDTVIVSSGKAWLRHTWNYNDDAMYFKMERSELIYDRIDALVIDVNQEELIRENKIIAIKGEPGDNPQRPTLIKDDENEHWQYPLAYILRKANGDFIEQQYITNMIGTDELPFVTSIPNVKISASDLLSQWQSQWDHLYDHYKKDFVEWFNNLQYVLDGDVAGHLQNEVDRLSIKVAKVVIERSLNKGDTTIEISNLHIREDSLVDIYCTEIGISPKEVLAEDGYLKIIFKELKKDARFRIIIRDVTEGFFDKEG